MKHVFPFSSELEALDAEIASWLTEDELVDFMSESDQAPPFAFVEGDDAIILCERLIAWGSRAIELLEMDYRYFDNLPKAYHHLPMKSIAALLTKIVRQLEACDKIVAMQAEIDRETESVLALQEHWCLSS